MIGSVCVVGLGKLGACLATAMALRGVQVVGVDKDPKVIQELRLAHERGLWSRAEPTLEQMTREGRNFSVAADGLREAVEWTDMAVLLVPTPSDALGGFSLDLLLPAVRELGEALRDRTDRPYAVVVGSTVMPGSTGGPVRGELEKAMGRGLGEGDAPVTLAYVPEFVALGDCVRGFSEPEFVVVGCDGDARDVVDFYHLAFLGDPDVPVLTMGLAEAELAKLVLNWCVSVKIAEANLVGALCERFPGARARVVCRAVGLDPRVGEAYFRPGLPAGGPCFPRDLRAMRALATLARAGNFFPASVEMFNDWTMARLQTLVERKLARFGPLSQLGILGLSFKGGTDCVEGSAGWNLWEMFGGRRTMAYDPLVMVGTSTRTAQDTVDRADVVFVAWAVPGLESVAWRKHQVVVDPWGLVDPVATDAAGADLVLPGVGEEG